MSLKTVGPAELIAWGLRRRVRYRVTGRSMRPLLEPNDQILARPLKGRAAMPGRLVVLTHPDRPELTMVKRVRRVLPDGRAEVEGLNAAESTDSRVFGPVRPEALLAEVTSVFR